MHLYLHLLFFCTAALSRDYSSYSSYQDMNLCNNQCICLCSWDSFIVVYCMCYCMCMCCRHSVLFSNMIYLFTAINKLPNSNDSLSVKWTFRLCSNYAVVLHTCTQFWYHFLITKSTFYRNSYNFKEELHTEIKGSKNF
jgi:hypothetical protein